MVPSFDCTTTVKREHLDHELILTELISQKKLSIYPSLSWECYVLATAKKSGTQARKGISAKQFSFETKTLILTLRRSTGKKRHSRKLSCTRQKKNYHVGEKKILWHKCKTGAISSELSSGFYSFRSTLYNFPFLNKTSFMSDSRNVLTVLCL